MKKEKFLVAVAASIMLAPVALNSLPTETVDAAAVGTTSAVTPIYDANGKLTGQSLSAGSKWKLGQQITLNGVANYQVATNEYVPATYITNVVGSANPEDDTQTVGRYISNNPDAGKTVTAKQTLSIVDGYGNETGRTLPANSQWKIGRTLHVNKMIYYEVGTNEYILATDVSIAGEAGNSNETVQDVNFGKTATIKNTQQLVDSSGKAIGVSLPTGSKWKLGSYMKLNGVGYYQVATNEWVLATGISVDSNTTNNGSYIIGGSTAAGKTGTITVNNAPIVNGAGIATGQTLSKGSQWKVGSQTLNYDKQAFYQVATDEFVSDMYMNINSDSTTTNTANTTNSSGVPTPGNGLIATLTKNQQVYNSSTNSYGQTLPVNSAWKISQLVVNKYGSYWGQVATNQWVWITDTRLNSGLNLKSNSYYEPEFATSIDK
ncbi:SLAP domain-containing protein [Companilactobacillus alimentarius]|uniref:S-layer protein C-terminal domain-containing protein n=1 Tax=Companilactobacillus alimentarius DSM 20249 TaxID=1423720 RepID=A0A2K9HJC6_9LACO|nr:SLAP domain-containing protein [Companilactobacillus alimentarius]AUI70865.1 hypothetical protein LA20249_01025 [Companilactobacillus alimentarius DSM 20249]KRK74972.1 hypothetical protein FC67_GL001478 [Companilactobacillus alimentarius DSM 20249]GEO44259.1 hypothetical protein LAL01_04910 [Companilactobacillus alimentarius]